MNNYDHEADWIWKQWFVIAQWQSIISLSAYEGIDIKS